MTSLFPGLFQKGEEPFIQQISRNLDRFQHFTVWGDLSINGTAEMPDQTFLFAFFQNSCKLPIFFPMEKKCVQEIAAQVFQGVCQRISDQLFRLFFCQSIRQRQNFADDVHFISQSGFLQGSSENTFAFAVTCCRIKCGDSIIISSFQDPADFRESGLPMSIGNPVIQAELNCSQY